MMRVIAAHLFVYVFFANGAALAEERRLTLAREIASFTDSGGMFEKVLAQFGEPLLTKVRATSPEKALELERMLAKQIVDVKSEMLAEIAKLFASRFTDAELMKIHDFYKGQHAFFQTDVGRKTIEVISPTNKEMLDISQKHIGKFMLLVTMMSGGVR